MQQRVSHRHGQAIGEYMNHHRRRPGIGPGRRAIRVTALAGQPIPARSQHPQGISATLPKRARIVLAHLPGHLGQHPIQQFGISSQ